MCTTIDMGIRRLGYTKQGDVVNNWPSESSQSEVISDLEPLPLDREFAQPRLPFDERLGHEELARSDITGEMK